MTKITIITADIIDSRQTLTNQSYFVEQLEKFQHPQIITPFSLSRGDELQGIIAGWLEEPGIIRKLRYHCRPLKLKIGIGLGRIAREQIQKDSWKMNGPAFHRARAALEQSKKSKENLTIVKTGIDQFDELINCIWLLIDTLQGNWTDKQWEAVHTYEKSGTYEEAAKILNISMQNVEKRCKAAQWKQIKQSENILGKIEMYLDKIHPSVGENTEFTH